MPDFVCLLDTFIGVGHHLQGSKGYDISQYYEKHKEAGVDKKGEGNGSKMYGKFRHPCPTPHPPLLPTLKWTNMTDLLPKLKHLPAASSACSATVMLSSWTVSWSTIVKTTQLL